MSGYWKLIRPESCVNLCTNPSFETNTTSWGTDGSNTIARSSEQSRRGHYSLKCTYQNHGTMAHFGVTLPTQNTDYSFSIDVYIPAAFGGTGVRLNAGNFTGVTANVSTNERDKWIRLELKDIAILTDVAGHLSLSFLGTPTAGNFVYVDGAQIEQKSYATTYCDGDQAGCKWNGAAHGSQSERAEFEATGGRVLDLADDLNFVVAEQDGTGMPPVRNLLSELALQPGALFEGQTLGVRSMTLRGSIVGTSVSDFHSKRQALIKALSALPAKVGDGAQPRLFRYTGGAVEKEIRAAYDAGLERGLPLGWSQIDAALRLVAADPLYYQIGESSKALDVEDSVTFRVVVGRQDGIWSALGPPDAAGTYTAVRAIVADVANGYVYFAGDFLNFNNNANADYIVRYNLSDGTWSALGSGLNATVHALALAANGDLYVGGAFTNAGGVAAADYIAVWNGSAFAAVGVPLTGTAAITRVEAIVIGHDGQIYIGGDFVNWNDIANADNVVKWTGSAYAALSTGANDDVDALAMLPNGDILLGGAFTTAGGVSANRVAVWDVSASTFRTGIKGNPTFNSDVLTVAVDAAGNRYAGGNFTDIGGVTINRIVKFTGEEHYEEVGGGTNGQVSRLKFDDGGNLYAAGTFTTAGSLAPVTDRIAFWNGSVWQALDVDLPGSPTVLAIEFVSDDLYIGFNTTGSGVVPGQAAISYSGTERAYPVFTIKRSGGTSATLRYFTNVTTGASLFFEYALQDGETLVIDLRRDVLLMESSIRGNVWNEMLPDSDEGQFYLTPGNGSGAQTNTILTWMENVGTPTITAFIRWRDAFVSED